MSTSSAALIIVTNSTTAQRQAKCAAIMPGYQHNIATVEQRQQYADCVRLLHPSALGAGEVLLLKAAIIFCIAAAVISGAVRYLRERDLEMCAAGTLIGGTCALATCVIGWIVFLGLRFVVTR